MNNFAYYNPVRILFGKGTIDKLRDLVPKDETIMLLYGGGSIQRNGVYDQVAKALSGHTWIEFGGIEPNPSYETCMKAVRKGNDAEVRFLLAVGGGSVIDGTKFVSAAMKYTRGDPWEIAEKGIELESVVPLGCVLTLPATGSEVNPRAVISRRVTKEKLPLESEKLYPKFSILDPETTFSMPHDQLVNGIIDAFIHVLEQYLTYDVNSPLQDRQAEAILNTLLDESPRILSERSDYESRANFMWCASQALNGVISCGTPQDWATHLISHEITALYGISHARALTVILPGLLRYGFERKKGKLKRFAVNVWGLESESDDDLASAAIQKTEEFFQSLGAAVRLSEYGIDESGCKRISERIEGRRLNCLGEHSDIRKSEVMEILLQCT